MPIKIVRNRTKPRIVEIDGSLVTFMGLPLADEETELRRKHTMIGPKGGDSTFNGEAYYQELFTRYVKIDSVEDLDDGPGKFTADDFKYLGSSVQLTLIKMLDDFSNTTNDGYKQGEDQVWRRLPEVAAEKKGLPDGGAPG